MISQIKKKRLRYHDISDKSEHTYTFEKEKVNIKILEISKKSPTFESVESIQNQ